MDDKAFYDYLGAREAALQGAAGYFAICNVPSSIIEEIAEKTTNEVISLAARVVLWQRRPT